MVLDNSKLDFLKNSLKNVNQAKTKRTLDFFSKQNKNSTFYFLELFLQTNNPILCEYFDIQLFESEIEEESFFERLFKKIISQKDSLNKLKIVEKYFEVFTKNSQKKRKLNNICKILLKVLSSSESKIYSMEQLVEYILYLKEDKDEEYIHLLVELVQFLVQKLADKENSENANHSLFIFISEYLDQSSINYSWFYPTIKKAILSNEIPLISGLIQFINNYISKISNEEILIFFNLWKSILNDREKMEDLCTEFSEFMMLALERILNEDLNFEILSICLSQMIDLENEMDAMEDDSLLDYYSKIIRKIISQHNEWIESLIIPFIKLLIFNGGTFNEEIGVSLLKNLELEIIMNRKNIFNLLFKEGVIPTLIGFLKNRDTEIQMNIISYFHGKYDLMLNFGMIEQIQIIYNAIIKLGHPDNESFLSNWPKFILGILIFSKENNLKLDLSREYLLSYINHHLEEDEIYFQILEEIFEGEHFKDIEVVSITVEQIFEMMKSEDDSINYNSLRFIFQNMKLDARPWFLKTLEHCLGSIKTVLEEINDVSDEYVKSILKLLLSIIQIFGEEVEPFISKYKLIQTLVSISEVIICLFKYFRL
jgi:hypothetical protein